MNAKIVIAVHKPYQMPKDEIYLPIHVGKNGGEDIGFKGDDTGDNISQKNPRYCELTGIYWAWKNLDADYIGLSHYRRHFSLKPKNCDFSAVLSSEQLEKILNKANIVLPKKRNYYIETLYNHYSHTHSEEHLIKLREVMSEKYPKYIKEFDMLKKRTSAHMFNMFVMKKEIFNSFCGWMFDILFELENRIDFSSYSQFDQRLMGRLSELMLDIWLRTNEIDYIEIPYMYMEKIDLIRKIKGFLGAKFFGKSYDKSF